MSYDSTQKPYMFGGHPPGAAYTNATTCYGRPTGRSECVRDCMNWSMSLSPELQGTSNYCWSTGSEPNVPTYQYTMPVQNQPSGWNQQQSNTKLRQSTSKTPMAWMSVPGQGGDIQPISIPVQVGPSGCKLGPLPTMQPIVVNAMTPSAGNGAAEPFKFQITPDQYLGGR